MRKTIWLICMLAVIGIAGNLSASTICPTTTNTNTDCGYIITIGSSGSITGATVPGANAYDGSDDALIGVINNSGTTYTGSFTISGSGNGGGIFDFESDGICVYTMDAYCATAATGYEGPLNTFANITTTTVLNDTGDVVISGLADGGSTFFSLESSPASINGGGGLGLGGVPEPSTIWLLGTGLAALAGVRLRRKASCK